MGSRFIPLNVKQFVANVGTPAVTIQGTGGGASYSYRVVAILGSDGTKTAASNQGSTAGGNNTLSAANFNRITWVQPPIASTETLTYDVYRTVGGTTLGKIGTAVGTTFDDTGLTGDGTTAPTAANGTGVGAWLDTATLRDLVVQASPSSGWTASMLIEFSQDGLAFDTVAVIDQTARVAYAPNRAYALMRARMTAYTSGPLPALLVGGHS